MRDVTISGVLEGDPDATHQEVGFNIVLQYIQTGLLDSSDCSLMLEISYANQHEFYFSSHPTNNSRYLAQNS